MEVKITLNEQEIKEALVDYIHAKKGILVNKITYNTAVKGDYDKGTAYEYVKSVEATIE